MAPIDAETADVIDRLRRTKEGGAFAAYLQRAFKEVQVRLIEDSDDKRFHVYQGEARVLKALSERWNSPSTTGTAR